FGANGLTGNTGIWKTTNGGATWTNTTNLSGATEVPWSDVAIDPNNPSILYAAVGNPGGSNKNGVYKSVNGGSNWTPAPLSGAPFGVISGRITIAVAKSNSQVVYVSASDPVFGFLYKFMRSDNGGMTWTDLTSGTPNYMGFEGWYATT